MAEITNKKRVYPRTCTNDLGIWAYIDCPQFYVETKEYTTEKLAIAALKRILNNTRYEIIYKERGPDVNN